jgi:RHS repeat-associated protein
VDTSNPIDVENGQATASSLSHATPSVSTSVANTVLVTAHAYAGAASWTPASGMTEVVDVAAGGMSIEASYVLQTPTGASGAKTATAASGAAEGNTHILALRPTSPIVTISKPAGMVENDVLIAALGFRPSSATITPPSGWTLVRRVDNNGSGGAQSSLAVYRKVAGASEPASYAWDVTGAFGAAGGIQAFLNVDTANPVNVENGQATAASLSHATPSVTTTSPNTMLVTAHSYGSPTTWTAPTGMTEAVDTLAGGHSLIASHVLQPPAAATGAKTATADGTSLDVDQGTTHILALRATDPPLTINRPGNVVAGDVMIAAIGMRPHTATLTVPSGWTLIRRTDNTASGASNSLAVYRKMATASEPVSYIWNPVGDTHAVGGIQAFYNVDTANPIDAESGQTTPFGLSHSAPSINTTVANAMIVTAHTFESATTWTPPTGMTEGYDVKYGGQSIEGNYVLQPTAGATGTKTATAAADSDDGVAHILALRPGTALAQVYYIQVDHLNTPRLVADAAGATVWRWDQQEPFAGNAADEDPDNNSANFEMPLRFPGQYLDKETNMHHNVRRDYDPGIGRYVQSDPLGIDAGINTYTYVDANPLMRVDPLGLDWGVCCPDKPNQRTSDDQDRVGASHDLSRNYRDMRTANTKSSDKYFHCKGNCEGAQRGPAGYRQTILLSTAREFVDQTIGGDSPTEIAADEAVNSFGREAGRRNPCGSCRQMCLPYRPNWLPGRY